MLSFGTRSLPDDLALEAPDTLSLYHALRSCSEDVSRDLDALDPTKFFSGKTEFLRQKDILEYEASLKHALIPLISSYDPHDPASPLHAVVRKVEDPGLSQISEIDLNMAPEGRYFRANLIYLVSDLCVQGDLVSAL
jgi:hypothetical protein